MPLTAAQLAAGISGILTYTRASGAWDVDSAGVLQNYAADVPLIGYQNALYGERVEGAGTNLALHSSTFDDAYWTKTSAVVTPDSDVAPDGTTTADSVNDNSAAVTGQFERSFTAPDDSTTVWCASLFVKKTGAPAIFPGLVLPFTGGTTKSVLVVLNTQTGAIVSSSAVAAGALDFGSWWRLWVSGTNNASGNTTVRYRFQPARAASLTTTADVTVMGSQVIWGGQLELGSFPSSYIPTVSATADRAAANTVHAMAADLANEFTCLVQARVAYAASSSFVPYLFDIQGATTDERIFAILDSATQKMQVFAVSGGISIGSSLVGGAITPPAEVHCAIRVRSNQIHASVGGGTPVLIASGRPASLMTFARGMRTNANAGNYWSTLIRKAQISPYEINDAALQALSA